MYVSSIVHYLPASTGAFSAHLANNLTAGEAFSKSANCLQAFSVILKAITNAQPGPSSTDVNMDGGGSGWRSGRYRGGKKLIGVEVYYIKGEPPRHLCGMHCISCVYSIYIVRHFLPDGS